MKKEILSDFKRGPAPFPPGVYRFGEPRINRDGKAFGLFIRSLIIRRSGRSPALPYPPNEYN